MATLAQPVVVDEPQLKHGGRGAEPPSPRGGDDGGGHPDAGQHPDRLRRYRIGLGVGLVPVVMLFVAFTSAYIVRQGLGGDWRSTSLPPMIWINTLILLASSVTAEFARRRLFLSEEQQAGSPPWLGITLVLGLGFLAGQLVVWRQLAAQGIFISTNPSSSFFYLLTGSHGAHLAGGVLAWLYAGATSLLRRPLPTRRIVLDLAAWYWHFMDVLWIYILGLMYFAK
ncbi:MAG: cytochrome c oxidase subunit 3 [Terriglobales bacterium]